MSTWETKEEFNKIVTTYLALTTKPQYQNCHFYPIRETYLKGKSKQT